jgi:hypothetical protein
MGAYTLDITQYQTWSSNLNTRVSSSASPSDEVLAISFGTDSGTAKSFVLEIQDMTLYLSTGETR